MGGKHSKHNEAIKSDQKASQVPFDASNDIASPSISSFPPNQENVSELSIDIERKLKEQNNLLRYKIEVLVNMLALEETKYEAQSRRLESLKLMLMTTPGIVDMNKSSAVNSSASIDLNPNIKYSKRNFELFAQNMMSALDKMQQEYSTSRIDILHAFADNSGKVCPSLNREDFMRQLYHSTTDRLNKSDVQVFLTF